MSNPQLKKVLAKGRLVHQEELPKLAENFQWSNGYMHQDVCNLLYTIIKLHEQKSKGNET